MAKNDKKISIVVPVYNEDESLSHFYAALMDELRSHQHDYEVLFVDDGSTDSSLSLLKDIAKSNPRVRVFSFRKNQGKAEALTLGFQKAVGEIIVTFDADLQDKPSEMEKFLEKQKEGVDVVSGWRKHRRDKSNMKIISRMFNGVLRLLFDIQVHDYNCGYKLYTRDAAKSLHLYGGLHRFIPLLLHEQGFIVDEVVVDHEPRKYGRSKYGFSKLWKDLPDMFTMVFLARYSKRPLHFFGAIGIGIFGIGFLLFAYLGIIWLGGESIGRRPLLIFSVLLMLAGLQIFFTGFIAELITSLSHREKMHFPLKYSSE